MQEIAQKIGEVIALFCRVQTWPLFVIVLCSNASSLDIIHCPPCVLSTVEVTMLQPRICDRDLIYILVQY